LNFKLEFKAFLKIKNYKY